MKKLFLYEIRTDGKSLLGALIKINSHGLIAQKIRPHEQVSHLKLKEYKDGFLNNRPQLSPIILGVVNDNFDVTLSEINTNAMVLQSSSADTICALSTETELLLLETIEALPELLLIDGHHRFAALQAINRPVLAWLVPIHQLSIESFIKVYQSSLCDELISKIINKFNMKQSSFDNENINLDCAHKKDLKKQINLYVKGRQFQIQVPQHRSYIETLTLFDAMLVETKLVLKTVFEYQPYLLDHIKNVYFNDHVIVTYTSLEHSELASQNKLLPIHTTCFKPKPADNSLTLLNTNVIHYVN